LELGGVASDFDLKYLLESSTGLVLELAIVG
jgi:hypothetical protein